MVIAIHKALKLLPLLALLPIPAARAQETPFFGEVVDVRVINVEAVVTSRGQRLQGLKKEDFRLLVDKAEVPIDYFEEAGSPGSPPPGISYLVFLDNSFSIPARRNPALEELRVSLARLRPEDRMAIVAYDGRRLEMLSPSTADRVQLQSALAAAKGMPAYGLQRRSEANRALALSGDSARATGRASGASFAGIGFDGAGRSHAFDLQPGQEIFNRVERVSIAAASALRGFQGGDGRKVLLLYSGGVPINHFDRVRLADARQPYRTFDRGHQLYRALLAAANRLGYTIYPIDIGVDAMTVNLPTAEVGSIVDQERRQQISFEDQRFNEELLADVAGATGGLPIFDGSRLPALERVQEDLGTYYTLGFRPAFKGDGRDHELKIEVLRKGAKVRTRNGFADLSRDVQLDLQVEGAHLFDAPLPADASFGIRPGSPRPEGSGKMVFPALFEIPADQLSWRREGDQNVASPELRIVASDDQGKSADVPRQVIEIRLPGEIQRGQKALYELSLKLRRRPHRLLVTLYDPPSGRLLAQKISVSP
jgi:VWFA-related protein